MSKIFRQTFLKPGSYKVGDRHVDLSAKDLSDFAAGTNAAIGAEIAIPLYDKHAPLLAAEQFYESQNEKSGVANLGWVERIEQDPDGSVAAVFDVRSDSAIKAIEDGRVKFSSPEFREQFTDGKGRHFGRMFRHFALTAQPRNPSQGQFTPALAFGGMQFSLSDLEKETKATGGNKKPIIPVRRVIGALGAAAHFQDDDEEKKKPPKNEGDPESESDSEVSTSETPKESSETAMDDATQGGSSDATDETPAGDAEIVETGPDLASLFMDVASRLEVVLPEGVDATSESGMKLILVAMLNRVGADDMGANPADAQVMEPAAATFSEDQIGAMNPAMAAMARNQNRLAKQVMQFGEDNKTLKLERDREKLIATIKERKHTKAQRDYLVGLCEAMQFSDGKSVSLDSIDRMSQALAEFGVSPVQFEEEAAQEQRSGFVEGDGRSDQEVKDDVRGQLKRHGFQVREKETAAAAT